jgi:hypothetical protein
MRRSSRPAAIVLLTVVALSFSVSQASGGLRGPMSTISTLMGRLARAGYHFKSQSVGSEKPIPVGAFVVVGANRFQVAIWVYRNSSDASRVAAKLKPLERSHPKQLAVVTVGADLYEGGVPAPALLPRAAFNKIVSIAEGR